jgi:hypothetical protein
LLRPKQSYNIYDNYYFVNLKPIKFFIYDFRFDKLIEINEEFRQSQVEYKKNEDYRKSSAKLMRKQTNKKKRSEKKQEKKEKEDQINNEYIIMKQLEYSLSKQETAPEITRLRIVSSVNFLIVIIIIIIFFAFMIIAQGNLQANINLVSNSFNLILNSISGVYYIRELILLNNPSYINFIPERTTYVKNITGNLLDLFSNSSILYNEILIKEISINEVFNSAENGFTLAYAETIPIQILQDNFLYRKIDSTLDSAFKEANTALYHIANTDISELNAMNKDVYFYLFNIMNSILVKFFKRSFIYISYIQEEINTNILTFLYILGVSGVVSVIAFVTIYYSFLAVILRKQSYLEVFFEIGEDVIKKSIENCEKFTTKLQIDKQNEESNISKEGSTNEEEKDEEDSGNPENPQQNPLLPFNSTLNSNFDSEKQKNAANGNFLFH